MLTRKSFIKIWKMVYVCFFRKPFSKKHALHPPPLLLSLSRTTPPPPPSLSHHKTPLGSLALQTPLKYEQELDSPTNHGEVRSCEAHNPVFFFFLPDPPFGFDCCRFWVMVFPVMGLGVVGGLKLMGFG
jgi:hypothetical protein